MDIYNYFNTTNSNRIDPLLMEVFDTNNCFSKEEELTIEYFDKNNQAIVNYTAHNLFLKDRLSIGSLGHMDIIMSKNEHEEAVQYCSLDLTKWFKKTRLWVRQYKILLRVLPLPVQEIKHIISFVRKPGPRYIVIRIENPSHPIVMALRPHGQYALSEEQVYQLCPSIKMQVKKIGQFELNEGENLEEKLVSSCKSSTLQSSNCKVVEEGEGKNYFVLKIHVVISQLNSKEDEYCLVTNKLQHRFIVGSTNAADVKFKSDQIDYQHCFLQSEQGKWSLITKETKQGGKNILLNINEEKGRKYKIKESTELFIGKNKLGITIPKQL